MGAGRIAGTPMMTDPGSDTAPAGWLDVQTAQVSADDEAERMSTLIFRVARQVGRSQRASTSLCDHIITSAGIRAQRAAADKNTVRQSRARVLAELRRQLASRTTHARLEAALSEAVLLDEVALLPPRQRFALRSMAIDRATVADVTARTGWTAPQIARLLRAALRTVTAHAKPPST